MRCEDVQPLLSDHLDGALPPAEGGAVSAHLDECAACRGELEDLRAVVAMLHTMPRESMPGGLLDRISAALAAEPSPAEADLGCDEARDMLSDRRERELDDEEAPRLEAHLAECPGCRRAAEELDAVVDLLRRVPREELPAGLPARIAAAIAALPDAGAPVGTSAVAARIGCDEAEDYMTGRLDGDLDDWEGQALTAHMEVCAPCAGKLAELAAVVDLLRRVPREEVPADLAERVSRALEAAAPAPPSKRRSGVSHWMAGLGGAVAACAVFMAWQVIPGAGVPRIETAAVSVQQDVAVNIGFDADDHVDGVIFQVDLPEGLKFIDEKDQPMLAQSVSWKGSLEKGKTVVPIVVRGIRPGRYEIEAFVRKGSMKRKTTIVLPVQG